MSIVSSPKDRLVRETHRFASNPKPSRWIWARLSLPSQVISCGSHTHGMDGTQHQFLLSTVSFRRLVHQTLDRVQQKSQDVDSQQ